jgi:cytochrome c2
MKLPASLAFLAFVTSLAAQKPADSPWGDFVEKDFPFFSSVLDCRDVGEGFPKDNLTPRGLILNLGHNLWACFDTDLLRIACIWEGEPGKPPVTPAALAPGSYHVAGQKTKDGQEDLPKPIGKVWLANGIYPGWQVGEKPSFTDPREPAPSKEEVGRGGLNQFEAIQFANSSVAGQPSGLYLQYKLNGISISEQISISVNTHPGLSREIEVGPHEETLHLLFGQTRQGDSSGPLLDYVTDTGNHAVANADYLRAHHTVSGGCHVYSFPPSKDKLKFVLIFGGPHAGVNWHAAGEAHGTLPYWHAVKTQGMVSSDDGAYVVDQISLPVPNKEERNVRLADIAFLNKHGDAVGVTFDGDVWMISGLTGNLKRVDWCRIASGFHEPMSVIVREPREEHTVRGQELLIFDRNGIWRLVVSEYEQPCSRYEMFCNLFAQTAETREFPNSMKLGPKGELYISKGGQEGTTRGKHNGTVIKVAADGKSFEVIGYGLRQPFIGVNAQTGLVTASDQQGHYVPSTPLHIIRDHQFYGHLPTIAEKEKYPESIAEPLTWIPHPVNPSGVTQTWLLGSKMGPVDGELIHIGYNRPELFRVLMNQESGTGLQPVQSPEGQVKNLSHFLKPQAALVSFSREFDFPTLNAIVNPADGQLYVTGFQVWGTVVKRLSGLARVRWTGKPRVLLEEVTPTNKGLVLRFNAKLDAKLATNPESYSAERWNYKRTPEYGSPHLKMDGSNGQEWLNASSAYLSTDGKSVLVAFPEMKTCHQMRIGWGLQSADGLKAANTAYFTPWELMSFDEAKLGFEPGLKIDLTPRKSAVAAAVKPTVEEGERLYQMFGCMACHSTDGTLVGKVGPSWKGLFGTERDIAKGMKGKVKADEAYLRESILNPSAKVVKGFEKFDTGMPIYAGILNDSQIESLILYIKSLK